MNSTFQPPVRTIADLLHRLGDVPPDRVRFTPVPGTATVADAARSENKGCELIEGTLVEKVMGLRESLLAIFLGELLGPFVRRQNLGILTGPDGTHEVLSGLVRLPDMAFVSWDRLPGRRIPDEPLPNVVPDLAVEILSASNPPARWLASAANTSAPACASSGRSTRGRGPRASTLPKPPTPT